MKNRTIHLEVIEQQPNESDTEGWSYILCGLEDVQEITTNRKFVTCKNCLEKMQYNKLSY
jgi:hypothetical protein